MLNLNTPQVPQEHNYDLKYENSFFYFLDRPPCKVRSPKSVRNSSYATRRRQRVERARGAPLCRSHNSEPHFSPNRPLCENKQSRGKQTPEQSMAHKAPFLRGLKQCSTFASNLQCCRPLPSSPLPSSGFMAKTAIRDLDWRNIWAAAAAVVAASATAPSLCLRELLNNVRRRLQNAEKLESP